MASAQQIIRDALALPPAEREEVAREILASLDDVEALRQRFGDTVARLQRQAAQAGLEGLSDDDIAAEIQSARADRRSA